MSRKTYPTQLRDHLGNRVQLSSKPFAIGGEGAVFEVTGRHELVAKLYSKPQSKERCEKLRAMAKLCSPDLLKFAAWPTATLSNGNPAIVEGILMPRITNHKEIHNLYSVAQRKKDFPEADWGFLLHTARNCAIAFESIHRHGHVVGDVNQKNVMVSNKGIIALVDCDSFQVKEGNRVFRCSVGVPEYTPPELHGRKFSDLDRNANHDLFGLAVMIFHLLMMGRHPFAGVPQVKFDIPIEKAIQDGLYAYARNPTKLKPPPHVPPIAMLDNGTRELFERAFGSSQRPTASEWRSVLDASMQSLQRCKNDPIHSYPAGGNCPWCQLITISRLMFFIPSQPAAGAVLPIEDLLKLIQKLTAMQLVFPAYVRPTPVLPIEVALPAELRTVQKPEMLSHPNPPPPIPSPVLAPLPLLPQLLARPQLLPMPLDPHLPAIPPLLPYPPAPEMLPYPKLHTTPPPPVLPPVPSPDPPDRFLEYLYISGTVAGVPVYYIAPPMGVIMILGFGVAWLITKLTEKGRNTMAYESLKRNHEAQCEELFREYKHRIEPIEIANRAIIKSWESANAAKSVEHARLCKTVDNENRRIISPWEERKAAIQAEHQRAIHQIQQANTKVLKEWEAENVSRQHTYNQLRRKTELENQRLISAHNTLMATRQAEYRQKCDEIDAKNRRRRATWEAANAPWIIEQKRWRDLASAAEVKILKIEADLQSLRKATSLKINQCKVNAEGVVKSHYGSRQDYERELRQAETDSAKIQLEEHLDRSLICHAKLKGISGDRLLSLESFGIETARDVSLLKHQKVPGIGPVLSQRLFDWREKVAKSFRPRLGLPESEKRRIASRYAPILLPLGQALQSAINEIESITAHHRSREAELIQAISLAVQDLAVAQAYLRKLEVV